jgi:hypothetical protein
MAALCRDAATPIADDEAASGLPERFAFRQAANIAQAFGHDAAGMGEISMPIHCHFKLVVTFLSFLKVFQKFVSITSYNFQTFFDLFHKNGF